MVDLFQNIWNKIYFYLDISILLNLCNLDCKKITNICLNINLQNIKLWYNNIFKCKNINI